MTKSSDEIGKRFVQLYEELAFVEGFLSRRVAGIRSEIDVLRKELGLSREAPAAPGTLELAFRRPFAVEAPVAVVPYEPFFPGWQIGCGPSGARCTVHQLPAPDSALTQPDYRLIAAITREDSAPCGFLSLEFDVPGTDFVGAKHFDTAARVRSAEALEVRPSLRILFDVGWHDLWSTPWKVGPEFASFSASFEIPEEFPNVTGKLRGARLIYYLPADAKLRFDLAYLLQGPRFD